jgi:hypothetical protein
MGFLRQIAEYLYLRKKDPNAPSNTYIRRMHRINRLSILLFLVAIIVMIYRLLTKK